MRESLTTSLGFAVCSGPVAAGTTNVNGAAIDLRLLGNYESVTFIAHLGAVTATGVPALVFEQSLDGTTWETTTLKAQGADTHDDKLLIVEAVRPTKPIVRAVLTRGTANAVLNSMVALIGATRHEPVVNNSTVAVVAQGVSPHA